MEDTSISDNWNHGKFIATFAIPAILLTGYLIGPMFLCILALGYIACYATHKLKSIEITGSILVFTVISAELCTIYEIVPHIWMNIANVGIIILLHGFLGHTAVWLTVESGIRLPHFEMIELILFSSYPAICTMIYTWFLGTVFNFELVPYFFLYIFFVIFQMTSKPRASIKSAKDNVQPVLEASVVGIIMLGQSLTPVMLYALKTLFIDWTRATTTFFWIEGYFIFSQSTFLSTVLPIKAFTSISGIDKDRITMLRWFCAFCAANLFLPVLEHYGFETQMMTTLKGKLFLFIVLLAFISQKRKKILNAVVSLALLLVSVWQLKALPWGFQLMRTDASLMDRIYVFIGVNLCLSVACIWALFYAKVTAFTGILLVFLAVFHYIEWTLYTLFIAPQFGLLASSVVFIYTAFVLRRNERITWVGFLVCLSMTSTKLLVLGAHYLEGQRVLFGAMTMTALFIFSMVALYCNFVANPVIIMKSAKKLVMLGGLVLASVLVVSNALIIPMVYYFFDIPIDKIHLSGCSFIIFGLLLWRSLFNEELKILHKLIAPIIVGFGFLVVMCHQYLPFFWSIFVPVALLGCCLATGFLFVVDRDDIKYKLIMFSGITIASGAILTFEASYMALLDFRLMPIMFVLFCGLVSSGLVAFLLPTLEQTQLLPKLFGLKLGCAFLLTIGGLILPDSWQCVFYGIAFTFLAISYLIKLTDSKRKSDEIVIHLSHESMFAAFGNVFTLVAFFSAIMATRFDFRNPYVPFISLMLFLLHRQSSLPLLRDLSFGNNHVPSLAALTLFMVAGVFVRSPSLYPEKISLLYWQKWLRYRSLAELIACVLLLPLHASFLRFHWLKGISAPSIQNGVKETNINNHGINNLRPSRRSMFFESSSLSLEAIISIFTTPISLVFVMGTSFAAYIYGIYSFGIGVKLYMQT